MSEAIKGLEPKKLWELFAQISHIPHGSKNEAALANQLLKLAEKAGFIVKKDDAGNMCVSVPATTGFDRIPIVVLQGHLDMVCEKNEAIDFNFATDPIQLVRDGDWVKADGTTLGADNGIGVAAALAVAMSENVLHGPLEILLTVDEETGLTGATGLSPSLIKGRILLNLDSEKPGAVCIGCAGGCGVTTRLPLCWEDTPDGTVAMELTLTGLMGGHSGLDIHDNRGNAIKLIARSLLALRELDITLAGFRSGDKHNAIPREGTAAVVLPVACVPKFWDIINHQLTSFKAEFSNERQMHIVTAPIKLPDRVLCKESYEAVIHMLMEFPCGVLAMSRDMPNLVETSSNLASVKIEGEVLIAHNSSRSSLPQALQATVEQVLAVGDRVGAINQVEESYPSWKPNTDSKILHVLEDTHEEIFGTRPNREATHAGLECGVIGDKLDGMDMVSFGPNIVNAHSPDEAVSISSVEQFWKLLVGVLGNVARGAYHSY